MIFLDILIALAIVLVFYLGYRLGRWVQKGIM